MEDSAVPQVVEKLVDDVQNMFEGDTRDVTLKTVAFIGGLLAHHSYYISKVDELSPLAKVFTDLLVSVTMDIETLKTEHPYQLEALAILDGMWVPIADVIKNIKQSKQLFTLSYAEIMAVDNLIGLIYFDNVNFDKAGYEFIPQLSQEFVATSILNTEHRLVSLLDLSIQNNIFNETNEISTFQLMHMCAVSTNRYFKTVGRVVPHFNDPEVRTAIDIISVPDRRKTLAKLFGLKQLGKYF